MGTERRNYRRYCVEQDMIQASFSRIQKTFNVKDISSGGMKLEYSPSMENLMESEMIDIIGKNYLRHFFLPKISCEKVYDIPTLMQNKSFKGGEVRIRGLKFLDLTEKQKDGLGLLIKQCLNNSVQ
jgi:c-di-GMP-binding flagellar brake protein YcgR